MPNQAFPCARIPLLLAAMALGCLIGCASSSPAPDISSRAYSGPPLTLDAGGGAYVVVAQSPTPGWVVSLDRVSDEYRHKAVFVSLKRPNPGFMYPQVIVEQRIATGVETRHAVKVYARVLKHDASATAGDSYSQAAQAPGK